MHDHEIQLAFRLVRTNLLAQFACVAARRHALVGHVETLHEPLDLLEMLELLAREPRQRDVERAILGIREDQREGGRRGFLLAIRMIDEQRRQVAESGFDPRARRGSTQDAAARGARESHGGGGLARSAHAFGSGAVVDAMAGAGADSAAGATSSEACAASLIGATTPVVSEALAAAAATAAASAAAAAAALRVWSAKSMRAAAIAAVAGRLAGSFAINVSISGCNS